MLHIVNFTVKIQNRRQKTLRADRFLEQVLYGDLDQILRLGGRSYEQRMDCRAKLAWTFIDLEQTSWAIREVKEESEHGCQVLLEDGREIRLDQSRVLSEGQQKHEAIVLDE